MIQNNMKKNVILVIAGLVALIAASNFMSAIMIIIYFIPTGIAIKKEHVDKSNIILLNVLVGWTLIGWIVALVWAARTVEKNEISAADEIEKLHDLKEKGIISDDEFNMKKERLL